MPAAHPDIRAHASTLGQKPHGSSKADESLQVTTTPSVQPSLVLEEERAKNGVPLSTYIDYFRQVRSPFITVVAIGFLVLAQLAEASTTVWLGYFTKRSIKGMSDAGYIGIYFALGAAYVVFEVRRSPHSLASIR